MICATTLPLLATNLPVTIATPPANTTVTEPASATFAVGVSGTPPYAYQWYRNAGLINGATNSSYTTPPTQSAIDNGAEFSVVITNLYGAVTSSVARLTVNPDVPTLVQVSSWYPFTNVTVQFSKLIALESATNAAHYALVDSSGTSVPITGATFGSNYGATEDSNGLIKLGLNTSLLTGANYTLRVTNIQDRVAIPHTLASGQASFTPADIRVVTINTTRTATAEPVGNQFFLYSGGYQVWGAADECGYTYKQVSGDFDVRLKVEFLETDSGRRAEAVHLMARESTAAGSRQVSSSLSAEDGFAFNTYYRNSTFGPTTSDWGMRRLASLPNAWLRLQRVGSLLNTYWGTNGIDWTLHRGVDTSTWSEGPLAAGLLVGIATAAGDNSAFKVNAIVSNFGPIREALSMARVGTDLRISWTGPGTLEWASQVGGPWTAMPGATSPVTVTPTGGGRFYRLHY